MTVERLSKETGIAKTTIYRRWPNASAIVMDAFLDEIGPLIEYGKGDTLSAIFVNTILSFVESLKGKPGELLTQLLGLAQVDPELKSAFVERWIEPRRSQGEMVLKSAIRRGELKPDANIHLMLDMIYGAIYYRFAISFDSIDRAFAEELVDKTFCGYYPGMI